MIWPALVVYAAITDGHGQTPIEARLVVAEHDVSEGHEPLFTVKTAVDFTDPLLVAELVIAMGPITFPEAGEYRIQLLCGGQVLKERRIQVMPEPSAEQ